MNDNIDVRTTPIQPIDPKETMRMDYYLATGQVVFMAPDAQEGDEPSAQVLNTLAVTEMGAGFNARAIGRVQQALQMNMVQRLGGKPPKFLDVVIVNITSLGVFTKAEFEAGSMLAQGQAPEAPSHG